MKAQNNKDIKKGIINFSIYLVASIFFAVCIFSAFMKTSSVEVYKILEKTSEYDKTQQKQISLTEKVDSMFFYTTLLNTDNYNYTAINISLSNKKVNLSETVNTLPDRDIRLYRRLANDMPVFFSMKDSIRRASLEEDKFREELLRCIKGTPVRQTSRVLARPLRR